MNKRDRNVLILVFVVALLVSGGYIALTVYLPGKKTLYDGTLTVNGGSTVCEDGRGDFDTQNYERFEIVASVDPSLGNCEFYVLKVGYLENYGRVIEHEWSGDHESWNTHIEITDLMKEGENVFAICGKNYNSKPISFDASVFVSFYPGDGYGRGTPTPTATKNGDGVGPTPKPGDGDNGDFWNSTIMGFPTWLVVVVGFVLFVGLFGRRRR